MGAEVCECLWRKCVCCVWECLRMGVCKCSGHYVGCNRLRHLEGALAACGARIHNAQTPRDPSLREEGGGGRVGT